MDKIFLLLGTNVGNLKENLSKAIQELEKNNIRVIKKSSIYKTRPWGIVNQPDFLNMTIEVKCDYSPTRLLKIIKNIESQMGRDKQGPRWGPRIIDIDILFYGNRIINRRDLTIPHREVFNRPFAIKTLAEIAPYFTPPHSKKMMKDYLTGIFDEGIEIYRN